jgi:hypothetical protein
MFARNDFYFRLQLPLIIIHIMCISLSPHRTSTPIHLTSVLGVLGTQETSCILIAGLLERDTFDLFLLEFDKPWVIHLRETCCCSTNLCTWTPNTVYKNRSVRRHQKQRAGSLDLNDLPFDLNEDAGVIPPNYFTQLMDEAIDESPYQPMDTEVPNVNPGQGDTDT